MWNIGKFTLVAVRFYVVFSATLWWFEIFLALIRLQTLRHLFYKKKLQVQRLMCSHARILKPWAKFQASYFITTLHVNGPSSLCVYSCTNLLSDHKSIASVSIESITIIWEVADDWQIRPLTFQPLTFQRVNRFVIGLNGVNTSNQWRCFTWIHAQI